MKTVIVLNGPNLNLLGTREPQVYGSQTLADVQALCEGACATHGFALDFRQSNHEGVLVDWLHEAGRLHAAGTLGGISTGQDLEVSIAIKPTSSIITPRNSIDVAGNATQVITKGRHDPCGGIRATPIAEAMLALVVMEHALRNRAQCGDVVPGLTPIPAQA